MKTLTILAVVVIGFIAIELFGKAPAKGTFANRLAKPYRRAVNRLAA